MEGSAEKPGGRRVAGKSLEYVPIPAHEVCRRVAGVWIVRAALS